MSTSRISYSKKQSSYMYVYMTFLLWDIAKYVTYLFA